MPVAVDRAVLLPIELVINNANENGVTPIVNSDSEALKSDDIYNDKTPHSPKLPPLTI